MDFTILHFAIHIVWRVNVICTYRKSGIARKMTVAYPELRLIKNAIEAQAKHLNITWQAPSLHISNDGTPILPEVRRDIFVPFYTTKSTGTGIGLALSRQIMTMQGCGLRLAEKADAGYHVTFVLDFRLS